MDVRDLNKSQLILLAVLISFVTSIATGITTVALMDQAPQSVSTPINKIVRETVERIVPIETTKVEQLSDEEKKLLQDLKAVQNLSASVYLKGETEDKLLASGLFLGEGKVILNSDLLEPKEGETYLVKSLLGEMKITKYTKGEGFTVISVEKIEINNQTEENATTSKIYN